MIDVQLKNVREAVFPLDQCCNCGTRDGTPQVVETVLRWTLYLGVFGSELRLKIPLPYCDGCVDSADRIPMGLGRRFLVWLGLFIGGIIVATEIPTLRAVGVRGALLIIGGVAAAIVWGWAAAVARPRGRQTSYYQPLRLRDFGQVIRFTNGSYAERVVSANPHLAVTRVDFPQARYDGGTDAERARSWFKHARRVAPDVAWKVTRWALIITVVVFLYAVLFHLRGHR